MNGWGDDKGIVKTGYFLFGCNQFFAVFDANRTIIGLGNNAGFAWCFFITDNGNYSMYSW